MSEGFVKQCGAWRKDNGRLIIVVNANEPTMDGARRKMLEREGVELNRRILPKVL